MQSYPGSVMLDSTWQPNMPEQLVRKQHQDALRHGYVPCLQTRHGSATTCGNELRNQYECVLSVTEATTQLPFGLLLQVCTSCKHLLQLGPLHTCALWVSVNCPTVQA